jgi:putative membrane protein
MPKPPDEGPVRPAAALAPAVEPMKRHRWLGWTLALLALELVVSAVAPHDRLTWFLETAPIMGAVPFLIHHGLRGRISAAIYAVAVLHALILAIGGHYTYAHVPAGDWLVARGWSDRNNYDKLGHLFQGITPTLVLYEVMRRRYPAVAPGRFLSLLLILAAGGISALYEIIEWQSAVLLGAGADEFLGTQGYEWDTQSDMLCALLGATLAAIIVLPFQERLLRPAIAGEPAVPPR